MNLNKTKKRGVASIPLILGMLVLIISVGVFISSTSLSDSLSSANVQTSNQALDYAKFGISSTLLSSSRYAWCSSCSSYFTIDMVPGGCSGAISGCASVAYGPIGTSTATSSNHYITSVGQIGNLKRTIQANISHDGNGLVTDYTWQ
jgi:hypothetical protein